MEYKDIFGGTLGHQEQKEQDYYAIGIFDGKSKAMQDYQREQRSKSAGARAAKEEPKEQAGQH